MSIDFSKYKDNYRGEVQSSIDFIKQDAVFFTKVKARYLMGLASRYLGNSVDLDVLDVGCGIGETDRFLIPYFKSLHGVDIAEGAIETAKKNNPDGLYKSYDGNNLPFSDSTFDLVFAICVMHYVPPVAWDNFVAEMRRVTKRDGLVIVFEHNPLNPLTRLAVNRCEFDADATLLMRGKARDLFRRNQVRLVEQRYILFFPWEQHVFSSIERCLTWLPLGAQYYVAGRK